MSISQPQQWIKTTIGEVTVDVAQREPEKEESFIYIDISSINRETKRISDPKQMLGQHAPSRARKVLQTGDVLVSLTRPNLNAVSMVPKDFDGQIASTGFDILRAIGVDPRWLFYLVQTTDFVQSMSTLVQGALYPAIRSRDVRAFEIPLAPINEQKRITDKIDSLLARVDACRDRLDRVPRILKRFRQSVLAAAISGKLTEDQREITVSAEALDLHSNALPIGWELKLMREVGKIQLGRQRAPKYHSGQHMRPYLRVQNIFENRIDLSDVMEMDFPPEDFETYQLVYGDILLNEGQSPEFLGRPAMYRDELPGACFTNTLIRFRAFDLVNRDFALLVFRHYMHCGRFSREGKITTNIAHLSAGRFANIEFPLPPLNEQQEIVRRASTLFSYADRLEVRYKNSLKRVDKITSALLSTAFRGELVPQDPSDEPAAVLLERIRAEQIAKPKRVEVNRKPKMPKMTEDSVKEVIRQLPEETFSFDELREKISGDYDSFKDILFTLLSETEPSLMQVFDQEAGAMCFVRRNQ